MKFEETQSALLLAGFGTSSISRFVHSVQFLNCPFLLLHNSKSFNIKIKVNVRPLFDILFSVFFSNYLMSVLAIPP
jgi:hypothetical protein